MSTELLSTAEAAERLGLTVRAVQKMIEGGRLPARKVGRDYVIDPSALENIPKQAAGRPPRTKKASKKAVNRWEGEGGALLQKKASKKGGKK